jgi:hypothetical protein
VLMAEIARVGRAPRLEQAEPLSAGLRAAIAARQPFRATLGGALIELKRGSEVVISTEAPRKSLIIP